MKKQQQTPRHFYTSEETEFLKKIVKGRSRSEINTLFNERFGLDLTSKQIKATIYRLGLLSGVGSNRWSDKPGHRYTSEEIEFLKREIKSHSYAELARLFNERFGLELSIDQIRAKIEYLGLKNGKGQHHGMRPPYTAFKKGNISWNFRPIGAEKIKQDGYVYVKVGRQWIHKNRLIWEKAHGPIPKGHAIIFADGNKLNLVLNNLLMVSYAERAVMNRMGLISSDPELTKAGLLVARLKIVIAKRARELKEKGITA
jgi:hypothetical protein